MIIFQTPTRPAIAMAEGNEVLIRAGTSSLIYYLLLTRSSRHLDNTLWGPSTLETIQAMADLVALTMRAQQDKAVIIVNMQHLHDDLLPQHLKDTP